MKQRPVLLILIPFALGILLSDIIGFTIPTLAMVLAMIAFLVLGFFAIRSLPKFAFVVMLLSVFFTGWIRIQLQNESFHKQSIHQFLQEPNRAALLGRVVSYPEIVNDGRRVEIAVARIWKDGKKFSVRGNLLLRWKHEQDNLKRNDIVFTRGTLVQADGERNPGEFNYRKYLYRRGIAGLFYVGRKDSIHIVKKKKGWDWRYFFFDSPRKQIASVFERTLKSDQNTALLKGLILGLRGEINPEVRSHFADIGVIHVLAVSGLHVGFVMLILLGIGYLLRLSAVFRTLFIMVGLIYYAGLTGFKPPVVRAVIMADLYLFGSILQRKADVYNILATAALVILFLNPMSLFKVGFQLSFAAVFSIVFFYSKLRPLVFKDDFLIGKGIKKILRWPLELGLVSVCAQVGTLPLTAIYFKQIPLLATFANLIVVPAIQVIVMLGFLLIGIHWIWSVLAQGLGFVLSTMLSGLTKLIGWLATLSIVKLDVAHFSPLSVFIVFGFFLMIVYSLLKRRIGWVVISCLIILNYWNWQPIFQSDRLEITFLDVGQGDACLVELPNQSAFLIDAGPSNQNYDAGSRTVVPYLNREEIDQLNAIFISHPHNDHFGGVGSVIRTIDVGEIYTIDFEKKKTEIDYVSLCDSLQIPVHYLRAGDTLNLFSPLQIQILSPFSFMLNHTKDYDANNCSLVMRLAWGHHRFLFCGDIERETEQLLLSYDSLLQADVLKAPHHGSITSNTIPFIKKVSPDWAVVYVGKWNRFNQPSDIVLNRFKNLCITYSRTDKNGAAVFTSDGIVLQRLH